VKSEGKLPKLERWTVLADGLMAQGLGGSISAAAEAGASVRPRIESVDLLRGIVMVVMALDHTRDYFGDPRVDLHTTAALLGQGDALLFVTRWITHFCAPVFVFLAGTSAYLATRRGKSRPQLARFLLVRGLWLIFLELTFVHFGWQLDFDPHFEVLQVIWAIGWAMVVLAGLVFLPAWAIAAFGALLVVGHNLFDGVAPTQAGALTALWTVLHRPGLIEPMGGFRAFVAYPLIPWVGVMALGFVFGRVMTFEPSRRRRLLFTLGATLTLAFVALRAINLYGDPTPWTVQKNALFTLFAFVNCEKYPPSLLYLLMTLGPALLVLGWLEGRDSPLARPLITFGRVPLFYYLLHLPLINVASRLIAYLRYGPAALGFAAHPEAMPADYGFSLPTIYLVWALVVVALYLPCRWLMDLKRTRRDWWLSYL